MVDFEKLGAFYLGKRRATECQPGTGVSQLDTSFDAQAEELGEILVKPKAADVHVPLFGLLWMPL